MGALTATQSGLTSRRKSEFTVSLSVCVQKMVNQTRLAMNAIGKKGRLAGIVMMLVGRQV